MPVGTKDNLSRIRAVAESKQGKCLSSICIRVCDRVTLQCAHGHVWDAQASTVIAGTWCKLCYFESKKAIHDPTHRTRSRLLAVVESKGGQCLSEASRANDRVTLRCAKDHVWDTQVRTILNGNWCRACFFDSQKMSLETIQRLAKERGGTCLSSEYVQSQKPLMFQCAQGHVWKSTGNNIMQGAWCKECISASRRAPFSEIQELAIAKGGVCLSTTYVNKDKPLQFRCARGHEFEVTARGLKRNGNWCRKCRLNSIDKMQAYAVTRGGKCLSPAYINIDTRLLWECADGHQWQSTPASVYYNKAWCPICARGKRKAKVKRKRSAEHLLFGKAAAQGA